MSQPSQTRKTPLRIESSSSGEVDFGGLLRWRAFLVFGFVAIVTWVLFGLDVLVFHNEPTVPSPAASHHRWFGAFQPALFTVATAIVAAWKGKAYYWLEILVCVVLSLSAIEQAVEIALFRPTEMSGSSTVLLLFLAAMIPWQVRYQAILAGVAIAAYPVAYAWTTGRYPEIAAYWAERNLNQSLLEPITIRSIIALSSIAISKSMYNMRVRLEQAERLGSYVIEGEIGKGGMGRVFKTTHAVIRRPTAVKVLRVESGDRDLLTRFEREVRLSATLSHPNSITIYDYGRMDEWTLYYAMELLDGKDLRELVRRYGPMPPNRALYLLEQICGSLAEAHDRGIIHRDLKPPNIFLAKMGGMFDFVKVLDFGLAKQLDEEGVELVDEDSLNLTQIGMLIGTPLYISPEGAARKGKLDARSDIYCLGCVVFWMLTGRAPFIADSAPEALAAHIRTPAPAPSECSEFDIPQQLDNFVLKCLAKNPDDRYQTIAEVQSALRSVPIEEEWTLEQARDWWEDNVVGVNS